MSFGKRKVPKHLILDDYHYSKPKSGITWIFLAVLVLFGTMMFSLYASAEESFQELKSGQVLFQNKNGEYNAALHLSSAAEVEINGLIAHVNLSQSFSNNTDQWQEGVYVFPLPENAAVNHMEMTIGDRTVIGEIKEKHAARKIYQKAKQQGKRAAITEQKRPNLFTQRVANIAPGQTVKITIHYVHSTRYDNGIFSWRMPSTITPRYIPNIKGTPGNTSLEEQTTKIQMEISPESGWASAAAKAIDDQALPASINSFSGKGFYNPITINISLNSGLPLANISSPYHDISISKHDKYHRISLSKGEVNMDRDFSLNWQAVESNTPQAALFSEEVDGDVYSLLMVLPPQNLSKEESLARDIVFIIDTSGSMAGTSMQQAKESLIRGLAKLGPQDRFNIIEFNSKFSTLFSSLDYAHQNNLWIAENWIKKLNANGGTEMHPALNAALQQFGESSALQQTIFITDGAVSNENSLFKSIRNKLGNSRLFTVAIGSAPNSFFMKKAAEFGRGTFTHIGNINQVNEKIDTLFQKLDRAIAKNIRIHWPGNADIYPQKIPDLYYSEPLVISARSKDLEGDVIIEGETARAPWQQHVSLSGYRSGKSISSVWARAKIEDLEDLKITGGNPEIIKQEITTTALRHKLLSAYTSFVAVEQRVSRPQEEKLTTSPIQNATPAGHASIRKVNYPRTATNAEITWWLGLFCLMLAIIIRRLKD